MSAMSKEEIREKIKALKGAIEWGKKNPCKKAIAILQKEIKGWEELLALRTENTELKEKFHRYAVIEALKERDTLQELIELFKKKRSVDGLNGRNWDAILHLEYEELIAKQLQEVCTCEYPCLEPDGTCFKCQKPVDKHQEQ